MTDEIRALLARRLPGYEVRSIARLGEGLDHAAYEVNGELILRASTDADPAIRSESTRREAALLAAVAELSALPVPEPIFADPEAGLLAYFKLPGVPLIDHPVSVPARLAPDLGELLGCLHQTPLDKVESLVERDLYPLAAWREDAERDYREIAEQFCSQRTVTRSRASSDAPCRKNPVPWRSATMTSGRGMCWWTPGRAP